MIVHLPDGMESLVEEGRYASTDEAMTAAVRLLVKRNPRSRSHR